VGLVVDTMAEIGVTRVSRWVFNCYVIHAGEGGPVIVDAGLPCLADDLAPVLADLAIDPAAAVAIVATHGHSDHVGGALALWTKLLAGSVCFTANSPQCIFLCPSDRKEKSKPDRSVLRAGAGQLRRRAARGPTEIVSARS
jgi:glyoxylase-like metal-dependent hydrolase (beta-lactamase superfamily II)